MKLCSSCNGRGCESCNYEGIDAQVSFTVGKINRRRELSHDEYETKRNKSMKFDKKNAMRSE